MKMKVREEFNKIKEMTPLELQHKLSDLKEELFNLRFQLATGHLDDYSRIKYLRKQIARVQTLIRGRELEVASV
jgi:large subunit ribosomal protein L29